MQDDRKMTETEGKKEEKTEQTAAKQEIKETKDREKEGDLATGGSVRTEPRPGEWLCYCDTAEREETAGPADRAMQDGRALREPRPGEWLLSLVMVAAAYIYVSVFGFSTALGRQIQRSANLGGYVLYGVFLVLFTGIFLAAGLGCVRARGKKPSKGSWGYFALTAAAALWFPFYFNYEQDIFYYMLLFLHGAAVYWLLTVSGNRSGEYLDERSLMDLGRGFITLPFGGYLKIFGAWSNLFGQLLCGNVRGDSREKRGQGQRGWQILAGVAISIPVIAIVGPMLTAADDYFAQFVESVSAGFGDFFAGWRLSFNVWTAFVIMLVACYLYGLLYNAFHRPVRRREKRLQAPQTVMGSFLVPLTLLYLVFFLVRLAGVAGAMERIAGGDLWISTYAREGFFELCRVAAVNLLVFSLARWYSPEAKKGVRLLLSGLGAETLAFIVLAFSKMWYYIQSYHSFTFKRAMCCWLLITLFVLFALMTAELWQRRIKGVRIGVLFGCVSFLVMAYSNMPAWAP